jgi:hypothetical protein
MCLGPYNALGNSVVAAGMGIPNAPESQAALTVDLTLPETVPLAMEYLVQHWYYDREMVTPGPANKIPQTVEDLLSEVMYEEYAPTGSVEV